MYIILRVYLDTISIIIFFAAENLYDADDEASSTDSEPEMEHILVAEMPKIDQSVHNEDEVSTRIRRYLTCY